MSLVVFVASNGRMELMANATLDPLLRNRTLSVAIGEGHLHGDELAAALACDWFSLAADASIELDAAPAWSVAVARIGRSALRLLVQRGTRLSAADAVHEGLCDLLIDPGTDPHVWIERWIGTRSVPALESGAALIRMRGGDRLERAEFARLFATGEPQAGLRAFLERRRK